MFQAYKSYLFDYKANNDARGEPYLVKKHKEMNQFIVNIGKNGKDDTTQIDKLITRYQELIDKKYQTSQLELQR